MADREADALLAAANHGRESQCLIAAARQERDRRLERYPAKIARGLIDAEIAAIDYQCWVAIAEWLETGHFYSFAGGIDPDKPNAPIVSWPELEAAAAGALAQVTAKIERMERDPDQQRVEPAKRLTAEQWLDKLTALNVRRARLVVIHRKLQLRAESIATANAELQAPKLETAA